MKPRDFSTAPDNDIVRRVLGGDTNAFAYLLERHERLVLKIAARHVPADRVEEIAQDAFVRAYQSLPGFRKSGNFQAWLSSIAVRTCHDFWRKQYRSKEVPVGDLSEKSAIWLDKVLAKQSDDLWREQHHRESAREVLDWALSRLSASDRMVVELVYLEGLSVKEASEQLGWSVANTKVRAFRTRKKLRTMLIKLEGER
jgi:RNA polymerase sigma-70 factor (ECF subfamily)